MTNILSNPRKPELTPDQRLYLILIALWIFLAMALPIALFYATGNLWCLTLFSTLAPPLYILHRVTWYLFPQDDRVFKLAETRAKYAGEQKKKQVP